MALSIFVICLGASLGALLRWVLSLGLNALWPALPLGTLCANALAGYLVGLALAIFAQNPDWPPHWRLLVVTGFLGGLSTFSTFSAEVTLLLQHQRWHWAMAVISSHLLSSLVLTWLGLISPSLWKKWVGTI